MTPTEIRTLRERLGLSQEAFAAKVGVSIFTVNRWERLDGGTEPSPLAMRRLIELAQEHQPE